VITLDTVEMCSTFGLMFKQSQDDRNDPTYFHYPFTLGPMPYPEELFAEALSLQRPMAGLIA